MPDAGFDGQIRALEGMRARGLFFGRHPPLLTTISGASMLESVASTTRLRNASKRVSVEGVVNERRAAGPGPGRPPYAALIPSPDEVKRVTIPSGFELSLELVDFAAGCAGGCVGVLCGHPFDTIKVRMQNALPGTTKGSLSIFRQIVKDEGLAGLAKGIETPLIGNVPVQAIVFGTYGGCLRRLGSHYGGLNEAGENPIWQVIAAGSFAGMCQAPAVAVAEYCKTQIQIQTETKPKGSGRGTEGCGGKVLYRNSLDCAGYVVRHHGPGALFRGSKLDAQRVLGQIKLHDGLTVTLIRDVSYGQWFGQYEWTKRLLMSNHEGGESPMFPIYSAMAGSLAGVCGWTIIFPIDTVKVRIQSRQAHEPKLRIAECVRAMIKEQPRFKAFTRGLGVCLVRAVPVNAVTFLTYEAAMSLGASLHE